MMNSATSVIDSTKEFLLGFRVPDLKSLWYGNQDAVDSNSQPILRQFEVYLVKLQELSLWTDPKSSMAALFAIHLIYWYLAVTTNSSIYLVFSIASISFLYTTWTQRIWPEIRIPQETKSSESFTPLSPDVLSAPELEKLINDLKIKFKGFLESAKKLRRDEPGRFCGLASFVFLILAFIGSYITTLGLFYYVSVGYLTIPGVLKILVKHPAVQCMLETMENTKNEDETDNKTEVEPAAPSLVDSVYSTLQSGFQAVSNLNLKSEFLKTNQGEQELSSLIPEENEANQSILESAMNCSTRDPTQAHNLEIEEVADSSLEYASLLPVTAGDLMPDDEDELDHEAQCSTLPTNDEFLPSSEVDQSNFESNFGQKLAKLEDEDEDDEDEFTASLMAAAAQDAEVEVKPRRKSAGSEDDFEMISEEELAQVSP